MTTATTSTIERLSLEGPLGSEAAIGIGIVLTVAFAGLLWWQRRSTGTMWAAVFLAFRVVALVLLLWMLVGPSWVTQYRTSTPQSVAVFVDTSASMDVSDPPSARRDRWDQAVSGDLASVDGLTECERATVAVRAAGRRTIAAQDSVSRHQTRRELDGKLAAIEEALASCAGHLETAIEVLPGGPDGETNRAERILSLVNGNVGVNLRSLRESLDDDDSVLPSEIAETLNTMQHDLLAAERRLADLTLSLGRRDVGRANTDAPVNPQGDSRLAQVAGTLDALTSRAAQSLPESISLRTFVFDQRVQAIPPDAELEKAVLDSRAASTDVSGESTIANTTRTDLTAMLAYLGETAGSESIQSAILLTDGAHNAVDAVAPQEAVAALAGLPVHVVPIGNSQELRDVLLLRVKAPTTVVEGDSILIDVIVTAVACPGESTTLTLSKNGVEIDRQPLEFRGERTDVRSTFQVPADDLGRYEFELSLDMLEDEADKENNLAVLPVNVVKDTLRVLLVDSIASWEYRYLDQLFRRDSTVTFDRLLFEPEVRVTGEIARSSLLPQEADGWSHYDVVILGDLKSEHLSLASQRSLDEFVRSRGGNLVVIAGREHMPQQFDGDPLLELLPVESGRGLASEHGLQLLPTPAATNHPALAIAETWADSEQLWKDQFKAQPLYSVSEYSRPKPTAQTLLEVAASNQVLTVATGGVSSVEHALLCWHQVGAGRVVYLAAPVTYRLRFRHGDRYHHRFWGQLLRWLTAAERGVGTQTVRLNTDRMQYSAGDAVAVTARLVDADGTPVVDAEIGAQALDGAGEATTINLSADANVPGRYLGSFTNLDAGAYRIVPSGDAVERLLPDSSDLALTQTDIEVVEAGNPELVDTRCNIALLRQIAELTGGQVVPPTALDELLAMSTTAPEYRERVESEPLWNRWSLLVIAFACLCAEWIARKRLGLA